MHHDHTTQLISIFMVLGSFTLANVNLMLSIAAFIVTIVYHVIKIIQLKKHPKQ